MAFSAHVHTAIAVVAKQQRGRVARFRASVTGFALHALRGEEKRAKVFISVFHPLYCPVAESDTNTYTLVSTDDNPTNRRPLR